MSVFLNIVAASVIAFYEETQSAVIALAVSLPIVSGVSGCTDNQAVAVSRRELSLGIAKSYEAARVWLQEISVALSMVLDCLIAAAALVWKGIPTWGLIVGLALASNTLVGMSLDGTAPLLLQRFKRAPAVAYGPILTPVT